MKEPITGAIAILGTIWDEEKSSGIICNIPSTF